MTDELLPDDQTAPEADAAFEIIESNRWLILAQDDAGYGIWPVDSTDDEPLRRFPSTDEGAEASYEAFGLLTTNRRGSLLPRVLLIAAFVVGVAWVLSSLYIAIDTIRTPDASSDGEQTVLRWAYTISQTGFPAFLVLSGSFVMLWLYRREQATSKAS